MSRPGASEPKNRATNSLRSGLVSQVAGGLLFRFWVRLVDESASGPPVGHTSLADGVVAATRAHHGHSALESGLSIYLRGIPTVPGGPQWDFVWSH
jgi:putative effector of murein hydrolase